LNKRLFEKLLDLFSMHIAEIVSKRSNCATQLHQIMQIKIIKTRAAATSEVGNFLNPLKLFLQAFSDYCKILRFV